MTKGNLQLRAQMPKMQTGNGSATRLNGVPWEADSRQEACPLILDTENASERDQYG